MYRGNWSYRWLISTWNIYYNTYFNLTKPLFSWKTPTISHAANSTDHVKELRNNLSATCMSASLPPGWPSPSEPVHRPCRLRFGGRKHVVDEQYVLKNRGQVQRVVCVCLCHCRTYPFPHFAQPFIILHNQVQPRSILSVSFALWCGYHFSL